MAEYIIYRRRPRAKTPDALEEAKGVKKQRCFVDLELKVNLGGGSNFNHRKEEEALASIGADLSVITDVADQGHTSNEVKGSYLEFASSTETNLVVDKKLSCCPLSIDLNETLEGAEGSEEQAGLTHEVESSCLISDGVIKGLDIAASVGLNNGFMGSEAEASHGATMEKNFGLAKELDDSESSYPNFNCEEQASAKKPPRKKVKKHSRPKIAVDQTLTPKPAKTPTAPAIPKQTRENKKPKPAKTPTAPATPKQTRENKKPKPKPKQGEKKPKLPKKRPSEFDKLSNQIDEEFKSINTNETVAANTVTKAPVARVLNFGLNSRKRSKRRRRLNFFNLTVRRVTAKRKSRTLFTVNWGLHKKRRMSHKITEMEITTLSTKMETLLADIFAMMKIGERRTPKGKSSKKRIERKEADLNMHSLALVSSKNSGRISQKPSELVPFKKKKIIPKVNLDSETLLLWNLLMNGTGTDEEQTNEENRKLWEKERKVFARQVASFNDKMFQVQGDRGFRKWKGSVLDSIVGVFLTQNVSDHLSSNAFMSLVSEFPPRPCDEAFEMACSQESVGSNMTEYDADGNTYFVNEPEPERSIEPEKVISIDAHIFSIEEVMESESNLQLNDETTMSHVEKIMQGENTKPHQEDATANTMKKGGEKPAKANKDKDNAYWESLRIKYSTGPRSSDHMDIVDWEAVRLAGVDKLAKVIEQRGQHYQLAKRIQDFLNQVADLQKILDLEWLRNIPPDEAKDYLLQINGLGLKSVECVRLLCLNNVAFPVDTNVGRIAIRLGWVPLQPLPEELQIHLLEQYPLFDSIQKYLWPRLCTLDQKTLYELHYQMITFGKVFCTKRNPNCNACPMRLECKHFASAFASSKLALPGPSNNMEANLAFLEGQAKTLDSSCSVHFSKQQPKIIEPIIEEPVELPPLELEAPQAEEDNEFEYDSEGIPTIALNLSSWLNFRNNINVEDSKALVDLTPYAAAISRPKLKNVSRLRTEHQVFELPRNHFLLRELEQTESDKEVQYHLAIWRPGETIDSLEPPKESCNSAGGSELCNDHKCFSCNNIRELNANEVRGTLLIPCRVAMRSGFPLNGTYYQVNEVFVDHETSYNPLRVPRDLIWNLKTKTAYFGSSISAILRGASIEDIQKCFWKGVICVRAFEQSTRAPKPLGRRFHDLISKTDKVKEKKTKPVDHNKVGEKP